MEKVTENLEKDSNNQNYTSNDDNISLESGQLETKRSYGARYFAVKILSRYDRSDSYIDKLLSHTLKNENLSPPDKSLLTEIVNGVIRWRTRLDWVLTGFYYGDYQKCLNLVKNAMRVALYQILYLNRIPIPAAINESVEIVKNIQGDKTAGIVNGVLRNIARNIENIRYPEKSDDEIYHLSIMHSHPKWMVKKWVDRYGIKGAEKLMEYNNQRPYIAVRVNALKSSVEEIKNIFDEHNIEYKENKYLKNTLLLFAPKYDLTASDLFKNGKITIQDPSATLAATLAEAQPGWNVVDLCAAPGGKSYILAEQMLDEGTIIALDKHESKMNYISEGAQRLGFSCIKAQAGDAVVFTSEQPYDLVFADVPCSGLGTLSKKPDIKWKKEPDDLIMIQKIQRDILNNAANLVKNGGVLIYSTCTIEPEENEDNIVWFLKQHPEFELELAEMYLSDEICSDGYMKIIPHIHKMDGAFAARLIKKN